MIGTQLLQWGRDQLIAEFRCDLPKGWEYWELQWGRDQLIAEFPRASISPSAPARFNGAAIS